MVIKCEVICVAALIDLTGKRFGRLVVLGREDVPSKGKVRRWLCHCDCGNEPLVLGKHLRSGATTSCGCLRAEVIADLVEARKLDITGNTYYALTALHPIERQTKDGPRWEWVWRCDCGKEIMAPANMVISGYLRSCGCRNAEAHKTIGRENNKFLGLQDRTNVSRISSNRIGANNTSGVRGVYWDKTNQRWIAYITLQRRKIVLYRGHDFDKAVEARRRGEEYYFGTYLESIKKVDK